MKFFIVASVLLLVGVAVADFIDNKNDAVVIEASDKPNLRGGRQLWLSPLQTVYPQNFFVRVLPTPEEPSAVQAPLNQACVTKDGKYGYCMTLKECYPERKIFNISAEDTWVMGLLNTCSINTRKGRQVFGICCVRGVTQPTAEKPEEEPTDDDTVSVTTRAECQLDNASKNLVSQTNCKASRMEQFFKIVNGFLPPPHTYKFMAALLSTRHGEPRQFCGGSLIDACHVLTAAHCIDGYSKFDVANLVVYLGAHNIKTNEVERTSHKVVRLIKHKGFDQGTLHNDVAILTLANCANVQSQYIQPICLPTGDNSFEGNKVIVAGWGALSAGGSQPSEIRAVEVDVWSNSLCSSSYGNQAPGGIIDSMICAASKGKDSCSGDSGGPLFTCSSPQQCMQVGIVSWGIGCAHEKYPGVYTRVTKMMDWIQRIQNCY